MTSNNEINHLSDELLDQVVGGGLFNSVNTSWSLKLDKGHFHPSMNGLGKAVSALNKQILGHF